MKEVVNSEKIKMKSTEYKHSKGITLIALVITIILLLILAVVSIQIVTDQGIIKHAEKAGITYTEAQERELIGVGYANYQTELYSPEKPETTDDYEGLQNFFLGEDRQGMDLGDLVNQDKSGSGKEVYTYNRK